MLFVSDTGKDIIDAYNTDTLEKIGRVRYDQGHEGPIGPRVGIRFNCKAVIAGCYDNTLSIIDTDTLEEIKTIAVGAYPIAVASDGKTLFTACGDSNSIWTVDDNFNVTFVDTTVNFPFCMAAGNDELCVCGFTDGEAVIYDKNDFHVKKYFKVEGYPYGAAYLGKEILIGYNREYEGMLRCGEKSVKLGNRVNKLIAANGKVYACVDDTKIVIMYEDLIIEKEIHINEPIGDFVVSEKEIFVSLLLGEDIVKFSQSGKEIGRININRFGNALMLS